MSQNVVLTERIVLRIIFYHPSECNDENCARHLIDQHVELTERIKVRGYVQLVARDHLGRFLVVKKDEQKVFYFLPTYRSPMSRFRKILDDLKAEIIAIALAFIIYLLAYYGLQEQIEFLPPILFFLAGAFTTAVIHHRFQVEFEKRKTRREDSLTMREEVYGPIFREMNKILESLEPMEDKQYTKMESTRELEGITNHYLFYKLRPDLKKRFYALLDRLDKHERIHHATQRIVLKAIRNAVEKAYDVDVGVKVGQVFLRLNIDDITVDSITLGQSILQRISPNNFIKMKRSEWGENIRIEVKGGRVENIKKPSIVV